MKSLWMLVASLLFAVMASLVKLASGEVGPQAMVFYRGLFGAVLIAAWAFGTGHSLKTGILWSHVKRSFYGTFALSLWLFAVSRLPLSTGVTLNYTNPLFMAGIVVGAGLIRRTRIEWGLVAATVAGFAGVLLVLQPEFRAGDLFPGLIGLLSGYFSALAYFQIRELAVFREPTWRIVFYFCIFNMLWGIGAHAALEPPNIYSLRSVLCIFGVGTSACLAQLTMTLAFGKGNLLLSSVLQFSGIIFAVLLGMLMFGESLGLLSACGIALIIAASAAATVMTKRSRPEKDSTGQQE